MKDFRYANRGSTLETFIKYANMRYRRKKQAFIEKQCTEFIPLRNTRGQVYNVKVEHAATFDFLGRYKQYPIAIEAKNTNSGSIRFDAVQENQADDMDAFMAQSGTIGLVVVSFNLDRFYAIPWAFWGMAYELRVRQRTKSSVILRVYGQEWQIPQKFSVRAEELLPEWEVPADDYSYGLHYLQKADQYVVPYETQNP